MCRELLGDAPLGWDGGLGGLLVLRAGRRGGGDLIPLVYLMEAVELRKNQLAVLLVLGSCGLRWLPGACSCGGASGGAWRLRELCCCGLVRAFVILDQNLMEVLEHAQGGCYPSRWIVEGVAWQPHLLSIAGKST